MPVYNTSPLEDVVFMSMENCDLWIKREIGEKNWACWPMTPVPRGQEQEDYKFEANLGCRDVLQQ